MTHTLGHPPGPPQEAGVQHQRQLRIITLTLTVLNILISLLRFLTIWLRTRQRNRGRTSWKRERARAVSAGEKGGLKKLSLKTGKEDLEPKTKLEAVWCFLPQAEIFPLVHGIATVIQGTNFIGVEGLALDGKTFEGGVAGYAETAWTGLWILPFVTVVFAVDNALRALWAPNFQPRTLIRTMICLVFSLAFVLFAWAGGRSERNRVDTEECDGTLLSFINHYAAQALGILGAIVPLTFFCCIAVIMALKRISSGSKEARLAATWEAYLTIITTAIWIPLFPDFALRIKGNSPEAVEFLATIFLNISAIVFSFVHLILPAYSRGIRPLNGARGSTIERYSHGRKNSPTPRASSARTPPLEYYSRRAPSPNMGDTWNSTRSKNQMQRGNSIAKSPRAYMQQGLDSPKRPPMIVPPPYTPSAQASNSAPSVYSRWSRQTFGTIQRAADEIAALIGALHSTSDLDANSHRESAYTQTTTWPGAPCTEEQDPPLPGSPFLPPQDPPGSPLSPSILLHFPKPTLQRQPSNPPMRPSRSAVPSLNISRKTPHKASESFDTGLYAPGHGPGRAGVSPTPPPAYTPREELGQAGAMAAIGVASTDSQKRELRPPPIPWEIAMPPGSHLAARRDEDAESFKEIPTWR